MGHRVHIDSTITIGNILTIVAIIGSILGSAYALVWHESAQSSEIDQLKEDRQLLLRVVAEHEIKP